MKDPIYEEYRELGRETEDPCECGSKLVLDSYGCIGGEGFGKIESCLDCSATRGFTPDKEEA